MGGESSNRKSRAITCPVGLKSFCVKCVGGCKFASVLALLALCSAGPNRTQGPLNFQPRSQKPVPGHGDFVDANLLERC
jgi:hypothetical protein